MTSKDIKTVELIVNSDQAKAKLEELNKKLDTMKQKREDALNRGDSKALSVYSREVSKLEKEIQRTETRAQGMSKAVTTVLTDCTWNKHTLFLDLDILQLDLG